LKEILIQIGFEDVDCINLVQDSENVDKIVGSINAFQLLKKDCAPWSLIRDFYKPRIKDNFATISSSSFSFSSSSYHEVRPINDLFQPHKHFSHFPIFYNQARMEGLL
jgi:hypothetical protein